MNFNVIKDINCKITAKPNEESPSLNLETSFWMEHYKKWVYKLNPGTAAEKWQPIVKLVWNSVWDDGC